jgi:hypothetical protein
VANRFRAIAFNTMNIASVVYHPKIRTVKAEADEDALELKKQYPNLKSTAVIRPGEPLWKDD